MRARAGSSSCPPAWSTTGSRSWSAALSRHFVLAFSGGLDTSYGLAVLVDRGARVTTVTVNTGGFGADELRGIETRAAPLGAAEHVVVDGRARLFDQFVSYILKANYLRNGVYPSCVGGGGGGGGVGGR